MIAQIMTSLNVAIVLQKNGYLEIRQESDRFSVEDKAEENPADEQCG